MEAKQSKKPDNAPKRPKPTFWATFYAEFWRDAFRENKSLVHVDLSHNNILQQDVEVMADGLRQNHSIYGLHFSGNQGFIDNQGFLKPAVDYSKADSIINSRIGPELQAGQIKDRDRLGLQVGSNCWICEGWTQVTFKFEPGVSDDNPKHDPFKAIKLHLEFDQYIGDLMLPEDENDP